MKKGFIRETYLMKLREIKSKQSAAARAVMMASEIQPIKLSWSNCVPALPKLPHNCALGYVLEECVQGLNGMPPIRLLDTKLNRVKVSEHIQDVRGRKSFHQSLSNRRNICEAVLSFVDGDHEKWREACNLFEQKYGSTDSI